MEESTSQNSLSLSNMIILGRLGRGGTSHVFKAQSTKNKKLYAMKVIDKKAKNYSHAALLKELNIHQGLFHPHIIRLQGHFQDQDNHYVLTEYCEGGEMTRLITEELSEQKLANVIHQIVPALAYLHDKGVAHCDLKLSNMLLQKGKINICDFGFSQYLHQQKDNGKSLCGTIYYLAPEILKEKKRIYYKQADIWALGISLLVLITKKQPYTGESFPVLRKQIIAGQRQMIPKSLSSQIADLMNNLLQQDPLKRISLQGILTHPFMMKYISNFNHQIIATKIPTKKQNEINDKIQQITKITSQNQAEQKQAFSKVQLQNKKDDNWTFKRTENQYQQRNELTIVKKSHQNTDDHQKTIKVSRTKRQQPSLQELQPLYQTKTKRFKCLSQIKQRLVRPFDQFFYKTKNDGFIKIQKSGRLVIKVKNATFEIAPDGQALKCQSKQYGLKDMNEKGSLAKYKQPYQLYAYAKQVIDILLNKKYAITWRESYADREMDFGITVDWTKIRCLRGATLLEWTQNDQRVNIRRIDFKQRRLISQLEGQYRHVFFLMKNYLIEQRQEQIR